jgi:hypothetical protein
VAELSRDPTTGEGSKLVLFEAGGEEPDEVAGSRDRYHEMFVLSGAVETPDGRVFKAGCYAFHPPGHDRPRYRANEESLVYMNDGGC